METTMAQRTTVPITELRRFAVSPMKFPDPNDEEWLATLNAAFGTQIPIVVPDADAAEGWNDERTIARIQVPYRRCEVSHMFPDGWLYQSLDVPATALRAASPPVEIPPEDTSYLAYYASEAAKARARGDDPSLPPSTRVVRRLTTLLDNPDYAHLQHRTKWLPAIVASYQYYLHQAATLNGADSFSAAGEMMGTARLFQELTGRELNADQDTITLEDVDDLTAWEQRIRATH